ncbi:MAG: biotin-dependent carboxyltransferase family protein, partial [Mycobacteriales bacterium]
MIEVLRPGPLSTVQDLGRPGLGHLGVSSSGAADRPAARLANRLVGNAENAATVEVTLGGLSVRFDAAATIAVTGAPAPLAVNGRAADLHAPISVRAGDVAELGRPATGVRSYLAVRGGIAVDEVLGSRCTDTLSGLGPAILAEGTRLPIGPHGDDLPNVDIAPVAALGDRIELTALLGPRDDWFTTEALEVLGAEAYDVTSDSDRVGLRLRGPKLTRSNTEE